MFANPHALCFFAPLQTIIINIRRRCLARRLRRPFLQLSFLPPVVPAKRAVAGADFFGLSLSTVQISALSFGLIGSLQYQTPGFVQLLLRSVSSQLTSPVSR